MTGRFILAKALLGLIAIDLWTPIELYGKVFASGRPGQASFWLALVVVTLLVAMLLWLTVKLGRIVQREFR